MFFHIVSISTALGSLLGFLSWSSSDMVAGL
jgi:hypothetical protein